MEEVEIEVDPTIVYRWAILDILEEALEKIWDANPEWRLGQLIEKVLLKSY